MLNIKKRGKKQFVLLGRCSNKPFHLSPHMLHPDMRMNYTSFSSTVSKHLTSSLLQQYQSAIRAHKAGKAVDFDELPVPPGEILL